MRKYFYSGNRSSQPNKRRLHLESLEKRCLLSATALTPEPVSAEPVTPPAVSEVLPGELLVGFKPGTTDQQIGGIFNAHQMREVERLHGTDRVRRVAIPDVAVEAVAEALSKNPLVEYAEPNFVASSFYTPNDPYYSYQWHLDNSTSGGIQVEQAWETSRGGGAVVAVLDTGVAYENYQDATGTYYLAPDLAETHFVSGYDFVNGDAHANDDHSHGTHVAGTIAQSTNNSRGVAGVAFESSVMPVKVLGKDGSGSYSGIANGIRWSADNGAHVINLSLGGSSPSQTLEDALAYAFNRGVTIVAAAGNDGQNGVSYPAAYDDYVIAVSATRFDEQLAPYSNYGSSIDLAAPGGDLSVDQNGDGQPDGVLQNTFNPNTQDTGDFNYYFFQGTSMAAPHVSGVAALIVSQGVTDPAEVRYILESTAKDVGPTGVDIYYGHGIVDAAAAMAALGERSNTAPVAVDDSATTEANTAVAIDVLANDWDADGDILTISGFDEVSLAGAVIGESSDGAIVYTPPVDFTGNDSFNYTISDGNGGSDTATVVVEVQAASTATTMHVADLDGSTHVKGRSGKWEAFVTVLVHNSDGQPVSDAVVSGTWSEAATGSVSGVTTGDGTVVLSTGEIRGGNRVTFTVDQVSNALTYSPGDNHDPDGDSDGTTIAIYKDGTTTAVAVAPTEDRTGGGSTLESSWDPEKVDPLSGVITDSEGPATTGETNAQALDELLTRFPSDLPDRVADDSLTALLANGLLTANRWTGDLRL